LVFGHGLTPANTVKVKRQKDCMPVFRGKTGIAFLEECLADRKLRKKFEKYIKRGLTVFCKPLKYSNSLINIEKMWD
jgi:hypothetical protein